MEFGPKSLFNIEVVRYVLLHPLAPQQHLPAVFCPVYESLDVIVENIFHDIRTQATHLAQSIRNVNCVFVHNLLHYLLIVGAQFSSSIRFCLSQTV